MTHDQFYEKCRICGGKRVIPVKEQIGMYREIESMKPCPYCGGKGWIMKSKIERSKRNIVNRNRRAL